MGKPLQVTAVQAFLRPLRSGHRSHRRRRVDKDPTGPVEIILDDTVPIGSSSYRRDGATTRGAPRTLDR